MKKLKCLWLNIPRQYRVVFNILATLLLLFSLYALLDCPAFTPEQKYRRMEKAELVGPAQILEVMDIETLGYDQLLLAEDGDAIILFQSSDNPWDQGDLIYREKTGPITVLAAPNSRVGIATDSVIDLPVFVFHEYPGAVRAELELEFGEGLDYTEVKWTYGEEVTITTYEKTWYLESTEEKGGFFHFNIHAEADGRYVDHYGTEVWETLGSEGYALEIFSRMTDSNGSYIHEYIPATVRLYDENDTLIVEQNLNIRSVAGEIYAQREGLE